VNLNKSTPRQQLNINQCHNQGCSANKKVWERIQKRVILKQLPNHLKAIRKKGVRTPFPRVPTPLHPWS